MTQQQPQQPEEAPAEKKAEESEDLSASSTSMARIKYESERDQRRAEKASDFLKGRDAQRKKQRAASTPTPPILEREALEIPVGPEFDPEIDDYQQATPAGQPSVLPDEEMNPEHEAMERAAKRLRVDHEGFRGAILTTCGTRQPFRKPALNRRTSSLWCQAQRLLGQVPGLDGWRACFGGSTGRATCRTEEGPESGEAS